MHITKFLKQVRNLLEFHKALGISTYPLTPEIKQFLGPSMQKNKTSDPAQSIAQTKESAVDYEHTPIPPVAPPAASSKETIADIQQEMQGCTNCRLHEERNHVVLGEGTPKSGLMIIGDWPSLEDDLQNTPLGGEAGDLLIKMLKAINLGQDDVFITLAVKCR